MRPASSPQAVPPFPPAPTWRASLGRLLPSSGLGRLGIAALWLAAGLVSAGGLSACGGDDGPPPTLGSATVDAGGGTVDGPDGTRLVVPPDAVGSSTTFRIARSAAGAPELAGLNAASAVYEVTPHDAEFDASALFSLPLAAAQLPTGATPLLLKASPGQPWRVVNDTGRVAGALSADLDALSWFVLAYCQTATSAAPGAWVIGAPDCPSDNSLRLELLDSNGTPIAVSPGSGGTLPPYVTVTGPTTLNFRIAWTRPNTTRTDGVSVTGTGGFRPGFTSTWSTLAGPGGVVSTTTSYAVGFSVSIDPAVVAAGGPREVRVSARADYSTTAFAVGRGDVAAGFTFETYIPILVRYTGTAPHITQQPTPASVSVVENTSFTLAAAATGPNLTYEWRYFQNAMDSAVRPAEGTNSQASYTSPPAQLGWNGRLYYVQVCTNRGVAGREHCAPSQASPLTVTPFTQPIAFTAQPVARDILEGESTTFNATVTGTPTPTLQWRYGVTCSINFFGVRTCSGTPFANGAGSGPFAGATIAVATTGTLTLSSVPLAANGTRVALFATQPGAGATSEVVTLTVRPRPVGAGFVQQLQPRTVEQNGTVDFSVVTSGTAPISYFWAIDGEGVAVPRQLTTGRCAGANVSFPSENEMRLTNVPLGCDGAVISVGIQNIATPAGTRPTSTALLTVTATPTPPSISANPAPSTVNEGQRATLTVGYGGTLPQTLTLQCVSCAQIVTGVSTTSQQCASPCSLQTPVLDASDNGNQYRIVHSNAQGDTATPPVTITVNIVRTPSFTTQPAAATVDSGQTATFDFAVAGDTGAFAYQWLANGQPLTDGSHVAGNGALLAATLGGASGSGTSGRLTLASVPLAANGVALTVRVTRTAGGQSTQATSSSASLTVNTSIPANALTATQIEAGYEWSLVLRPDRTVWAWGGIVRNDGRVQYAGMLDADRAMRPVQLYPAALSDIRAISGWSYGFWALKGEPGSAGSRVLHWGRADAGSDGRGGDGNGSLGSSIDTRYNEAAPVEVLERVNNVPQPVDRVCAVAGGGAQLAMIRAIDGAGNTTDCNAGSAKTVWFVGALIASRPYESTGVAFAMPGLPTGSPPAAIFTGKTTSGSPPLIIALEDGRLYGRGANPYGGLGIAASGSGDVGGLSGPAQLPSTWGNARSFGMSFFYSLFAVRADGTVMASGYDASGELGLGSVVGGSTLGPLPVKAETCTGLPCADVLTGVTAITSTTGGTTLALKNGQILGWGAAANGLRGPGATGNQPFPLSVPSAVAGFTALSASNAHALVIGPGNVVYAWGSGLRGALGDGVNGNTRTAPAVVTIP